MHYNIVYNSSQHHDIHSLKGIAHMVKTYIHYNIVYNPSLHHAIHALKSIAHIENEYTKNMESHSHRNVHDENPYTKKWTVIRTEMCMTKTHSKRNGSHSYRNVHDENPYTRKWIVIRTKMCIVQHLRGKCERITNYTKAEFKNSVCMHKTQTKTSKRCT